MAAWLRNMLPACNYNNFNMKNKKKSHIQYLHALLQMEAGQDARQRMVNDKLAAAELATTAVVALPPIVPLRELAEALRGCRHQAFPVTPDPKAAAQSGALLQSSRPGMLAYR